MTPLPGLSAKVTLVIGERDTSIAMRTGDVPVLATPRLLALMEEAAVLSLHQSLEQGQTSVGASADLQHLGACGIGSTVIAEARLVLAEGRNLGFDIKVTESTGGSLVATARHRRVLVDREKFLSRLL